MSNVNKNELIKQYEILHQTSAYGISSIRYKEEMCLFIDYLKPKTVLDYGCGQGVLLEFLKDRYKDIQFYGYDPAIKEINTLPITKCDLVINTDVLEHIPEESIPNILKEISSISNNVFFGLHHALSLVLPNGENAHCTIKPPVWYHLEMMKYFKSLTALKGRKPFFSSAVTFPLTPGVINAYYNILFPPAVKETQFQRLKRHLKEMKF